MALIALALAAQPLSPFSAACLASGGAAGSVARNTPIELVHSAEKQVFTLTLSRDGSGAKLVTPAGGWVLEPGMATIVSASNAMLIPDSPYGLEFCMQPVK